MRKHPEDPIESDPEVGPSERLDTDYSPSSERETEVLLAARDAGARLLHDLVVEIGVRGPRHRSLGDQPAAGHR